MVMSHELYFKNKNSDMTGSGTGMPWETAQALPVTIQKLTRKDLIGTRDRMTHPSTRSRVISCVYGKTFPLRGSFIASTSFGATSALMTLPVWGLSNRSSSYVINDFAALLKLRKMLPNFGPTGGYASASKLLLSFSFSFQYNRRAKAIGWSVLGAVIVVRLTGEEEPVSGTRRFWLSLFSFWLLFAYQLLLQLLCPLAIFLLFLETAAFQMATSRSEIPYKNDVL
jgi:hypothetical protein